MNLEPKIRVAGMSGVSVDPVATVGDLAIITRKLGRLTDTNLRFAALNLATCAGDVAASVRDSDSPEGFADEIADTVIAAFVVAAEFGLDGAAIQDAIQNRLGAQSSQAVGKAFADTLSARGIH